jgi:outer membrane protein
VAGRLTKSNYMRIITYTLLLLTFTLSTFAQVSAKWDLRRCVEYAMANNISVKEADIQARVSAIILKQSKYQQIPSLAYSMNHGYSFGRSLDRTTNVYVDRSLIFENLSLQSSATIFNWNSQKNTIASNKYSYEADQALVDKAKNDIGLTVARQYLLTLLSLEQTQVNEVQLKQTQAQYQNTRKLVDAGSLPELNAAELEAQVARDSATFIQSRAQNEIDKLTLKGLLNLPADTPFEVDTPPVESIPVDNILELSPAAVYDLALKTQPQIKGNNLRLMASERNYQASKGRLYPTISAFGQLNSNYTQFLKKNTGFNVTGQLPTGTWAQDGNVQLPVYAPKGTATYENRSWSQLWDGYWAQLQDQFGKSLGISLNVPIFNGWQARANVERSKLEIEKSKLSITRDTLQLKLDVYNAYEVAMGSYQTYVAREKQVKTAERSFDLASKRYEVGVMQTIEWLTNQNNLTRAKIEKLVAQYDYVFKMKVLEFYKGQGIRL